MAGRVPLPPGSGARARDFADDFRAGERMAGLGIMDSALSDLFFGRANIEALHAWLRARVHALCGQLVARQSEAELLVVMRGTFLEYAAHEPRDVLAEVRRLDGMVVDFCAARVASEVGAHLHYVREISRAPEPLARGMQTSCKGERSLEMKRF